MDIIQLLPDSVANQIAAGEVIQRPASVIKELVENAVDAGAMTINVLVVDAGRTLVQVIDNGKGMSETDARLAFERHATSKIRKADDLFSLHTMGFRGEALPSIAAVAQVELSTRTADEEIGTRLHISASRVTSQEACACQVGSNFKVENLFFNVPARRRFLKSDKTELSQCLDTFERIALVYPEINFTFHSNGGKMFDLRRGSLRQRIVDVFGNKINQVLLPVEVDTTLCRITGFVGKPESAKRRCPQQYFFVNGRYMRHPAFAKAVQQAFERLIPNDEQVPYFVYFNVDPKDIDVNVHPTKTEIKFENEQAIWQILHAAVKEAVGMFSGIPTIDFDTEGRPSIPVFENTAAGSDGSGSHASPVSYNPFRTNPQAGSSYAPKDWEDLFPKREECVEQDFFGVREEPKTVSGQHLSYDKSPLHFQYKGQYVITSVKSGLMIVDQHKAHVRVLYEQYLQQMANHRAMSQRLLFPESVQFTVRNAVQLDTIIEQMNLMGFELSPLGAGSYAVDSVPAGLDGLEPTRLVIDMVEEAVEKGDNAINQINESLALSMARKAAIPVGQVLSNEEMDKLVADLFACPNINYTPDGQRIYSILEQTDIDKLFCQ